MSRFLISCGGTGGHLTPGIALAEGLQARGHEVRLLISRKKVDARLMEKYAQFDFVRIPGTSFSWKPLALLRCAVTQARGWAACLRMVRSWRPHGIVAFGGFSSAGVSLAGWVLQVPVALHESNRVPGLAVRVLGFLAQRVYLPQGVRLAHVRVRRMLEVGMPVRREISRLSPAEARQSLGLNPAQRVLVVLGGSQGSGVLNAWVRASQAALAAEGVQVYSITGLGKGERSAQDLAGPANTPVRVVQEPFCDRVAELLSAADLVVARAGAGTIAELIRCTTPAILVALPQAADDHQRANAAFFERQGGGMAVEEARLDTLLAEVRDTIGNDWLLEKFRANLQRMNRANPLETMADDLEDLTAPPAPRHHRRPAMPA